MARRALLVGIDQYQNVSGLRGCGNDVSDMFGILCDVAGFRSSDVRAVAHERATKAAIEERIQWLISGARPGDLLMLHFSGHGAQVRVREGATLAAQIDEVLCPHDMSFDGNFITNAGLREQLRVPQGVVLEVVLDACHSGEGRVEVGFPDPVAPAQGSERRPRFVQPPVDIVVRHSGLGLPITRLFRDRAESPTAIWSACAEQQTAADAQIAGVFHGAFTFYFCQRLREAGEGTSRLELLHRIRASLAQEGFSQVPELSAPQGLGNRPPFQA